MGRHLTASHNVLIVAVVNGTSCLQASFISGCVRKSNACNTRVALPHIREIHHAAFVQMGLLLVRVTLFSSVMSSDVKNV